MHLKKIAPSGGRRENVWGISCEKSRFYAKKSYFFPILGGRWPPPLDPPLNSTYFSSGSQKSLPDLSLFLDSFFMWFTLFSFWIWMRYLQLDVKQPTINQKSPHRSNDTGSDLLGDIILYFWFLAEDHLKIKFIHNYVIHLRCCDWLKPCQIFFSDIYYFYQ